MATENNILGLRAQITGKCTILHFTAQANIRTANMNALGMTPRGEIVTVMDKKGEWEAVIVQDSEVYFSAYEWHDTKEAALEDLLRILSADLCSNLEWEHD
jgi:hypothetical protein